MHTEQTRPMKSKLVGQSGESELEVTGTNELSGWAEVADFPSPCASGISSGGPGWEETVCVFVYACATGGHSTTELRMHLLSVTQFIKQPRRV